MRKILKDTIANENEIIGNLRDTFAANTLHFQQRKSFSILEITGNITLAYYRGLHVGGEGGMKLLAQFIAKKHPELKKEMDVFIKRNKVNN